MGNYVSCKLSGPVVMKNSKSVKVILPTGEIRKILLPAKAAELMMEVPNYFIVNSKTLRIGRRFYPLNADDDLDKANVYVMLPMHRKCSVVTAGDLGVLFMTANSAVKRVSAGRVRVMPDTTTEVYGGDGGRQEVEAAALPRLSLEGVEDITTPEFRHRLSMTRSKRPLLETIDEELDLPVVKVIGYAL